MEGWSRIWAGRSQGPVGEETGGPTGPMCKAASKEHGGGVENGRREDGRGRVRGAVVGGDGGGGGGAAEDESPA